MDHLGQLQSLNSLHVTRSSFRLMLKFFTYLSAQWYSLVAVEAWQKLFHLQGALLIQHSTAVLCTDCWKPSLMEIVRSVLPASCTLLAGLLLSAPRSGA